MTGDATLELKQNLADRLIHDVGVEPASATLEDWYVALVLTLRARLVERWLATSRAEKEQGTKRVYYLSMEFLIGRALTDALASLGLRDQADRALAELGVELAEVEAVEPDPGLGNGGLGRLAACFLESMTSQRLSAMGYGLRYEYGMFAQKFQDGWQTEVPDPWLAEGNPWEYRRSKLSFPVHFGGHLEETSGHPRWVACDAIVAAAYDILVPGHGSETVNALRLWAAHPEQPIDLAAFNRGDYQKALEQRVDTKTITRVLYPDDSTDRGRALRLRQEYFFISASLQDILQRFRASYDDWDLLPEKVAIHLNDTHPSLAIPELMRLLLDEAQLEWERAWKLTTAVFSYTNHTLMPEALETWPRNFIQPLLPRHLQILETMNQRHLEQVRRREGATPKLLRQVSLIDEDPAWRVNMGRVCVLGSHRVNGVSALHSKLVKETLFPEFAALAAKKFLNVTNGITPRRWLAQANPRLSALLDSRIGRDWRRELSALEAFAEHAEDGELRDTFMAVKHQNKERLAARITQDTGIAIDPRMLFDVQIKRIHEYKRQLLNIMQVIARYNRIKEDPKADWVPRAVVFGGKAASAYWLAKLIIKLINDVAVKVNGDPEVCNLLKVVFVPNYGVSYAETIIPAADLSEQISLAGTEASGTGNMKLALNGALTIGTEDGANIEIADAVGRDKVFIFGLSVDEVKQLRQQGYEPRSYAEANEGLSQVLAQIRDGVFSPDDPSRFRPIIESLLYHGDGYMLLADFAAYLAAQDRVDALWRDRQAWARWSVLNVAGMGYFSSDRAVRDYAEKVWHADPIDL